MFNRTFLGMIVGSLLLVQPSLSAEKADPAGTTSAKWFSMGSRAFFATPAANRSIPPTGIDDERMAAALFHETNRRREKANKPTLGHEPRLDEAARMHARSMAKHQYVSHANPNRSERRSPRDRALQAGFDFRYLAENVANNFAIRYSPGRIVYPVQSRSGAGFSYQPGGSPIPPHTYASFSASLLDQWMNSEGHRKNILADEPERFGSGCAAGQDRQGLPMLFCVQLFGTPRP